MRNSTSSTLLFFIVQLSLWERDAAGAVVKYSRLQLRSLPSTDLTIGQFSYKLHGVLFHLGRTMDTGHYTACVRSAQRFVKANDDTITEYQWPDEISDAYVLVYRRA